MNTHPAYTLSTPNWVPRGISARLRAKWIAAPGATDASLPRDIPIGTYIKKQRWHLSYEENGQEINDFSIAFYAVMLSAAIGALVWAVKLKRGPQV